jgi:hypothetical protein
VATIRQSRRRSRERCLRYVDGHAPKSGEPVTRSK